MVRAPRHLGCEINQQRVDGVTEAFLELVTQNVPDLPPGSVNVWQKVLTYTGSCCRRGHRVLSANLGGAGGPPKTSKRRGAFRT